MTHNLRQTFFIWIIQKLFLQEQAIRKPYSGLVLHMLAALFSQYDFEFRSPVHHDFWFLLLCL